MIRLWGFGVALFGGLGAARRPEVSPPFLCCFSKQQPQFLGERPFSGYSRSCPLPCLPCLYTTCAKELLRPTVGLLCLCQGLWIRTRQVLCCPRAGTRWRTFRTQRYSKVSQKRQRITAQEGILGGSVVGCPLNGREKAWRMEGHYRVPSLFSKRSNPASRPVLKGGPDPPLT